MIRKNLCQVAQGTAIFPTANPLEHKQIYFYSEDVASATIVAPNYFSEAADESVGGDCTLNEGDIVFIYASDGVFMRYCDDAVNGTVAGVIA
jgi:hypothetical protein